ncbi:MAG: glycosyltransferase [Alphaproteobacteria bacterium]|nr:glycosyltransferase [Alphaproteobacteria bacterium]
MSGSPPAAPSLTVVVPTYGRAGDLSALLERLVPQLGERKSLVIVNDGSPSPAYDRVIAAHASPHLRYLVLPRNIGRGGARNAGAAACDTGWIVFTDDDCRPPPGWLDRIASLVARHDGGPAALDLIGGRTYPVLDHPPGFLSRVLACAGYHPNPVTVQGDLHCAVTAACAVRASALAAVGGFDPAYTTGEDLNLTARLTRAGYRARIARDWWTGHTVDASLPETCGRFFRYGRAAAQNAFALSDWSAHYFRTSMTLPAILRTIRRGMARRHARFARARFPMAERLAATAITGVV